MVLNIVLMTFGIAMIIESLVALFFPNWTIKTVKKWTNKKTFKRVARIEFIIALILFLIGMNI